MAKYSNKSAKQAVGKQSAKTVNLAGGEAFVETPKLEFVSLLLTSFVQDQFYRSEQGTVARVREMVQSIPDKKFLAKTAIFARNEFGMRSISHVAAAEIARAVKGEPWTKSFFNSVVRRVDDITEILAYWLSAYGKPIPNSLKKGLGLAFGKFDAYQLGKYRGEGNAVSLVDAVNLLRPKPTDRNAAALKELVNGTLRSQSTWEGGLSQAGQDGETAEEVAELKKAVWKDLIEQRKIGYFALLRNLRNILEQAPEAVPAAIVMLKDSDLIHKSLVLPFRYLTAIGELEKVSFSQTSAVVGALEDAMEIAFDNVPKFPGKTLIALDGSGSMNGSGAKSPIKIGALFAAALIRGNDADFMLFSEDAQYYTLNPRTGVLGMTQRIISQLEPRSTNFHAPFLRADKAYDRIVILSDMQGWVGYHAPTAELQQYRTKYQANPYIYSFDLAGYGTLQFPEKQVYALAGFSEKVFDIMKLLEQDKNALVHKIESIEL